MTVTGTRRESAETAGRRVGRASSILITIWIGLAVGVVVLFVAAIALGPVDVPIGQVFSVLTGGDADRDAWTIIVKDVRLPQAITATAAGAALGVAGLQMQTLFRNPLADPFILGVSSGAGLGVALVVLTAGTSTAGLLAGLGILNSIGVTLAATVGAVIVLLMVLAVARRGQGTATVLIVGLMMGYIATAVVAILIYVADDNAIRSYLVWTLGSFNTVTWPQVQVLGPVVVALLAIVALTTKPLNVLLLGETYAASMGLNVKRMRVLTITTSAALAAAITAFAGPIAFVGIAVPHLARGIFATSDHKTLVPACILIGAWTTLGATLVSLVPGGGTVLPINAVTSLIGAPIVIWVLVRGPGGRLAAQS